MTASPLIGLTSIDTVTIKKGASTASLVVTHYSDGSLVFTDPTTSRTWSTKREGYQRFTRKLYDVISAFV